jgi:magnesium transporter
MKQSYRIENGKITPENENGGLLTVYYNPDEAEKKYLVEELKLDEHTLMSALDPDELSRLEFEPEHIAIILKRPKSYSGHDQFLLRVGSTGAFLFKDKLIIVMAEEAPLFDSIRFLQMPTHSTLLLKMIYRTIYHFLEHLKIINQITDELQSKINMAMENRNLINMFALQKSLVYYLNSINANGVLIEKLKLNAAKIGFTPEAMELLDDISIENTQCYKQAEIYSNILASLMDARASIVGNNLNVLMKTLNIITIGIMVPTFVVSAFSMNVHIPFEDHSYAFWAIMGMALFSEVGLLAFWRWKRW